MRRYSVNFPMIPVPLRFQSTRTTPTRWLNPLWVRSFSARGDEVFPVVSLIRSGGWIRFYAVIFSKAEKFYCDLSWLQYYENPKSSRRLNSISATSEWFSVPASKFGSNKFNRRRQGGFTPAHWD